eukprot:GEMP01016813.1.p1 GENE.GEMP01016813.1~~GEMP01016813.1.p1  ORF type:complete len:284 (+),score=50.67 GEMP01016813.1:81-932(+)
MLILSKARHVQLTRVLRAGGAEDVVPRWTLPSKDYHKYTFQPTIPDKHFNIGHFNYAPITLWLRARRPTMEKVGFAVKDTTVGIFYAAAIPIRNSWDAHLPGFGYKCMGFLGLLLGYNLSVMYWQDRTEAFMSLEKLALYRVAHNLQSNGFFQSESEEQDSRLQAFNLDSLRLEKLFAEALQDATEARSFERFASYLEVDESHNPLKSVPEPISWRLNSMPYGRDNPDAKVFDYPQQDKPADSNYFMLDMGSVGDYIDRQDNKGNPIRKARHMYCSVYAPPTK